MKHIVWLALVGALSFTDLARAHKTVDTPIDNDLESMRPDLDKAQDIPIKRTVPDDFKMPEDA